MTTKRMRFMVFSYLSRWRKCMKRAIRPDAAKRLEMPFF